MLDTLLDRAIEEWRVIKQAPIAFALCVFFVAAVIFIGLELFHSERAETQEERLGFLQDQNAALKAQLETGNGALAAAPAKGPKAKENQPSFVSDLALQWDSQRPLGMTIVPAITMDRLRVELDVVTPVVPGTYTFANTPLRRIAEIADLRDLVKSTNREAELVTRRPDTRNNMRLYWGDSSIEVSVPTIGQLSFLGPGNKEQRYTFVLLPATNQPFGFAVIYAEALQRIVDVAGGSQ